MTNNQSIVYLVNHKRNQTYIYNITNITSPLNFTSRSFETQETLFYPQSDTLLVAGNGLIAIINATRNYNNPTKFRNLFNPNNWYTLAMGKINNESFVVSFADRKSYGSTGRLITFNLTNFNRIADYGTTNFPQEFTVLNETTMINQYYFRLNEHIYSLPYLNITNSVTLDSPYLQRSPKGIVTNNASSYYINTEQDGLFYFNNITNGLPSFNFGQNLTILRVSPLN